MELFDLVGKRGVILQHGNSTRRQKGPKDGRSCFVAQEVSYDGEVFGKAKDAALLTVRRIKK